ncbi:hypothetical protein QYE76_023419 [Lolium multiflorum]|uniref:TF-B3 domain-containing protein n=1 Tax=Lolium multiflorum TaxID=4521 RepID=A0AAD8RBD0_LOLMU|nr:hypothetical protein QYE76_031866 [Lolium multiflorum]KAK1617902.1 hypothetical protein QYE76_023419 [Lolium multiflorum]
MGGRGGGRARGRGRGRGRAARSPSPATPSASSPEMDVEGPVLFEFLLVLKGDPRGIQRLPDSFAVYVAGDDRPGTMHLREASSGFYRWIVDVIYDARGKMYLHIGWEKFARRHSLEAGFILLFSYFGDRDMSVKVFDETCCRRDKHDNHGDSTDEEDD